ncbi:ABC transporter permease [Mucilaginibacter terrae]|uniref:ABC-2 type transport system permease protein n=1 Tax=Mucilaginibacter terrae TaxID=1955052 RepID=A0ABU3H462_9SPHI|nr:ABC transporter permease [Mucilaginibacter terrae]MDT3405665.1 ABC-2 type transport system permease protein [Mucilaginibacter terrae]
MNKVLLIIQREYISRVRKKAFVVTVFLVPALLLAMYAVMYLIYKNSSELNATRTVKVIDESGQFSGKLQNKSNVKFENSNKPLAEARKELKKHKDYILLYIPKNYVGVKSVQLLSEKKPNITTSMAIERQLNDIATNNNMVARGIDTAALKDIKSNISISAKEVTETGDKESNVGALYAVGVAGAIIIYLSLFIYGAQVMRGVIEEKTNRIIEVIVSSVKPFQLMLGKIIGVALVSLTQFLAWIILSVVVSYLANKYFNAPQSPMLGLFAALKGVPFGYIIGCFLFYFLTGFLLYSALFAAVGSAVDSESETQQFMFPITMPLLFTYLISVSFLAQNPDSSLAVWLSMIPFTAPVAMMVRLPFDPEWWQVALSMGLMIVGFIFTTWVAARIYRVGILMYGKKASYKELVKWFFYKE